MSTMHSGAELLDSLGKRGMALNASAQALAVTCGPDGHYALDRCFKGVSKTWPKVPAAASSLRSAVVRAWTELVIDIRGYAKQLAAQKPGSGSSESDIADYLRNVVLAKLQLEPTSLPAELATLGSGSDFAIGDGELAALRASGVGVVSVTPSAAIDLSRLHEELVALYEHDVISPTQSSCNPGAHGINVRCGTREERKNLDRGTPALRVAMDALRAVPHALECRGYRCRASEQLAVPAVCLVSAYPPGAHYARHLDCYGDDKCVASNRKAETKTPPSPRPLPASCFLQLPSPLPLIFTL